jgi:hypothetical protein
MPPTSASRKTEIELHCDGDCDASSPHREKKAMLE